MILLVYALLEEQKAQYDVAKAEASAWVAQEIVEPLLVRQWLLAGIWPESLTWSINWSSKTPLDAVKLGELAGVKTVVDPDCHDSRVGTVSLRMRWVVAGVAMSWACRMGRCDFTVRDDAVYISP